MIGVSLVIKPAVYYFFGLYRRLWNYASMNEMKLILIAVTCASAVVSAVMVIFSFSQRLLRISPTGFDHRLDPLHDRSRRRSFLGQNHV
jgi:FlaA1/EpsC-like NDP-sugar epimerase